VPPPGLELETALASWPAVVDIVRERNAMLAALLTDARPVEISDRDLTLAFPSGAAFLKRKAEQDDHRRVTADALRTVTGQALALRYELREELERKDKAGTAPVLSGEELVQRFMEEFDAEELLDHDDPDQGEAS
jgi:DNA polymerase-3 subunit gamma/tau